MVGRFRRTVSFPNPNESRPSKPPKSHHTRSTSLPCSRSHPLIPRLHDEINALRCWENTGNSIDPGRNKAMSSWFSDGLRRLKTVHDSLNDVLQLPQTRDTISCRAEFVEKVLDDFLHFVDVYGIFQTSMLGLKQELLSAQVALRRRDDSKLGLYVNAQTKIAKEMRKLVSTIRSIERPKISDHDRDGDELASIVRDVDDVTTSVSALLLDGIARSLTPTRKQSLGVGSSKRSRKQKAEEGMKEFQGIGVEDLWGLRKKGNEQTKMRLLEKMKDLEDCICGMDGESERVFRSLISARVSLLNILTH